MTLHRRQFLAATLSSAIGPLLRAAPGQIRVGCQTRAYGSPIPDRDEFLAALADLGKLGYEGLETNYRSLEHSFNAAPTDAPRVRATRHGNDRAPCWRGLLQSDQSSR